MSLLPPPISAPTAGKQPLGKWSIVGWTNDDAANSAGADFGHTLLASIQGDSANGKFLIVRDPTYWEAMSVYFTGSPGLDPGSTPSTAALALWGVDLINGSDDETVVVYLGALTATCSVSGGLLGDSWLLDPSLGVPTNVESSRPADAVVENGTTYFTGVGFQTLGELADGFNGFMFPCPHQALYLEVQAPTGVGNGMGVGILRRSLNVLQ